MKKLMLKRNDTCIGFIDVSMSATKKELDKIRSKYNCELYLDVLRYSGKNLLIKLG